ncbi:MAG: helix-turn-helix transcriptional regulator [Clostridia bacterium]|nr:helix-turn-helix transcriptional regulator [Clostridia bacterium]
MKDQLILLGARAESYIKDHLSQKLDRDTICRALSTNRTTLSRALLLRTGRTLRRFILDERINMSKALLLSGEQNMSIIAEKCGFADASYFSRAFREQTGMTPTAYVKSETEQNDTVWHYSLDGELLPHLPSVHDCAVAQIHADGEYLSLYFNDELSMYVSVSRFRPGAKELTIRYHLCDPCFMVYRRFRHQKNDGTGYEIGYSLYDDAQDFLKEAAHLKLLYLYHCIEYNTVVLKLWASDDPYEVMREFNADTVEYRWGFEPSKEGIIDRMKGAGIRFEAGMSDEELEAAELCFGFTFPREIAAFLRLAVPTGEQFFDYKDLSQRNVDKFKAFRRIVESGFAFDIQNVPRFRRAMEKRYDTSGAHQTLDAIMTEYHNSPKLIPFYGHRCFFDGLDDLPIFSYSQPCDSILYGENFEDYLKREFCGEKRAFPVHVPSSMNKTGIWAACLRTEPHITAHDHCGRNRKALHNSQKCGCFYCLNIFSPKEIDRWIDDDETALCPYCQIDSVIGDASGYSITEAFLKEMNAYWFSSVEEEK